MLTLAGDVNVTPLVPLDEVIHGPRGCNLLVDVAVVVAVDADVVAVTVDVSPVNLPTAVALIVVICSLDDFFRRILPEPFPFDSLPVDTIVAGVAVVDVTDAADVDAIDAVVTILSTALPGPFPPVLADVMVV